MFRKPAHYQSEIMGQTIIMKMVHQLTFSNVHLDLGAKRQEILTFIIVYPMRKNKWEVVTEAQFEQQKTKTCHLPYLEIYSEA